MGSKTLAPTRSNVGTLFTHPFGWGPGMKKYFRRRKPKQQWYRHYKLEKGKQRGGGYSGITKDATITTSEGTQALGAAYQSPFTRKIERNKKVTGLI